MLGLPAGVPERVSDATGLLLRVGVPTELPLRVPVAVREPDLLCAGDFVRAGVCILLRVPVMEARADLVGVREAGGAREGERLRDTVPGGEALAAGVGNAVRDGLAVVVPVTSVGDTLGEGDVVTVGVPPSVPTVCTS